MQALKDRQIVLLVSGGIAAYKSAELASSLVKEGARVHVVMTKHACAFVTPLVFETLTKHAVVTDTFDRSTPHEVKHVALAQLAELIVIAPATANIIAKAAAGIADDFASTLLVAARCPRLFAPAMNTAMYENRITQRNIATLKEHGAQFIAPEEGMLACGDTGTGRMAEPGQILHRIRAFFERKQDFAGRRIVVTAGPTVERIDAVRYLTNRSSGKMGYAIAEAALARGADVTLISGPVHLTAPKGVRLINVESAAQMKAAVFAEKDAADIIIKAAAVADYTPRVKVDGKLKKGADLSLELVPTEDILLALGKEKGEKILVGFAAEAKDIVENAQEKLRRKNIDLVAANDISRDDIGFAGDQNALTLLFRDGRRQTIEKCSKREAADRLLDAIQTL